MNDSERTQFPRDPVPRRGASRPRVASARPRPRRPSRNPPPVPWPSGPRRVVAELNKVFIGQDELVRGVLAALLADGHVLIESVPGLGKTLLVRALGRVLGCAFNRIQFTPDLMPSDVTGSPVYDERIHDFRFRPGPVFTQLLLADEINRAPAKTHSALLEIMQETRVTIDGVNHPIERPFLVMATQNPIESEGTYNLPEAQLDRFLFKLVADYPSRDEETNILRLHTRGLGPDAALTERPGDGDGPAGGAGDAAPLRRGAGRRPRAGLHRGPGAEDPAMADVLAGGVAAGGGGGAPRGPGDRGAGGARLRPARRRPGGRAAGAAAPRDAHPRGRGRGPGADELLTELIRSVEVPLR